MFLMGAVSGNLAILKKKRDLEAPRTQLGGVRASSGKQV